MTCNVLPQALIPDRSRDLENGPAALAIAACRASSPADTVVFRYFLGAIVTVLSAGASWGTWILWQIAANGSFTGVSALQQINAHGQAQIYGWVGLSMMGFAYMAFPRMWQTPLAALRLAIWPLVLMLAGISLRTVGMALHLVWSHALAAALLGSLLQIISVGIFAAQIVITFHRSRAALAPYVGFILASMFWFMAMVFWDAWHTYTTMSAASSPELLWYIATYQAPLRDMQIHGVALCMILGISLWLLPHLYGVRQTPSRAAGAGLALITTAVFGEVALFVGYRWTGNHVLAAGLMLPWLMLIAGTVLVVWPWRLWKPLPERDRSGKFIRFAFAWLGVSLLMLLLLPVYQGLYTRHVGEQVAFSHAYYGAIRHAITVGFISLMIMGVSSRVVPALGGLDVHHLATLWGPFLLVNAGCFLRVSLQIQTDWDRRFYPALGISGVFEVVGLAWWAAHLVGLARRGGFVELARR